MGRTGSDGGGCFGVKVLFLLFQLVEQRLYLEEFVLHGADFAMAFFGVQLGLDMVLLLFGPFVLKVVEVLRHFLSGGKKAFFSSGLKTQQQSREKEAPVPGNIN